MNMTTVQSANTPGIRSVIRNALLVCGILSSLLYLATDILASMRFEGYSYTAQSISELSAAGAPTRPFVVAMYIVYDTLVIAFGLGVWAADNRRRARFMGISLVAYGVMGVIAALFFPMHLRGDEKTISDTMHITFTGIIVLFIFISTGLGASLYGKRFRYYSIGTVGILLLFGILAGMDGPKVAAHLPTPWLGITERINVYAYLIWVIAQASLLLRIKYRPIQAKSMR